MSETARELSISEARDQLSEVVNRASYGGQATYITRRGRRLAMVLSPEQVAVGRGRYNATPQVSGPRQLSDVAAIDVSAGQRLSRQCDFVAVARRR